MSTENNENQNQSSSFWWGLIVGGLAAGLAVYFLEKDKEEKESLVKNLRRDWEGVLEKIKELVGEKNEPRPGKTLEFESILETTTPNDAPATVTRKPVKKFFKKAGKKLH